MGALPMRDMSITYQTWQRTSPPTRWRRASRSVMSPLAGGQDGDAEAAEDTCDLVVLAVHPQTGLGHTLDARDHALALRRVLHVDVEHLARASGVVGARRSSRCSPPSRAAPARDFLELRGRHRSPRRASRRSRCEGESACRRWDPSSSWSVASSHQLAFVTPGISPAWASSRRQTRQRPNLRYTERGRPHRRHRV